MNIFNKQPKFIAAKCPNCGGRLELDSDFEVAYCADCGSQCIIKNAKKTRKGPLDKVLNFVERQQSIQRQDAQEKEREKTEENKRKRELKEKRRYERKVWWNKNWKTVLGISIGIIILSYILQYLGL